MIENQRQKRKLSQDKRLSNETKISLKNSKEINRLSQMQEMSERFDIQQGYSRDIIGNNRHTRSGRLVMPMTDVGRSMKGLEGKKGIFGADNTCDDDDQHQD